jgi:hypothetical protein
MKIATLLNVHGDARIVNDALDAVHTYMTKDVLVLTDGAAHWTEKPLKGGAGILVRSDPYEGLQACRIEGLYHNQSKSPYRNMTLGLKTLVENWWADWYCYMEYDCLVVSEDFKEDLENAISRGVWVLGNDHRQCNYQIPFVEMALGEPIGECHVILGCCVFFHSKFMHKLASIDFFNKFLLFTNDFRETVPGLDKQGAYDLGEVIYPTLAAHLGGRVEEFAHFVDNIGWVGNANRYPMRFRPEIQLGIDPEYPDASIIHPIKSWDHPLRNYYRERRKRQRNWKTFSATNQLS